MGKAAVAIELSVLERRELVSLARAQKTGQAMARRGRIVLAAAAGAENKAICVEVGADANTVSKWRRRFAAHRLDGLFDGWKHCFQQARHTAQDRRRRDRRHNPPDAGDGAT